MALTESRPTTGHTADGSEQSASFSNSPMTVLGSGDHKSIGVVYIVAGLLFGIAGWIASAVLSAHQASDFLSDNAYLTLLSHSRVGLILLAVIPIFIGIGTYVVPLQVGANTIAFPRAAAMALWTWLISSAVLIVANCIDGGLTGGSEKAFVLGLLSLAAVVLSLSLAAICVVTTVVALRTPGMRLDRVPMTSWSLFIACSVWLITLPAIVVELLLIWIDVRYGNGQTFAAEGVPWQMVSWVSTQPQVYAALLPAFGILADVIATMSGRRLPQRNLFLGAVGAFGVLSVGVYAQRVLYPEYADQAVWVGMSILIVLPVLLMFAVVGTALKAGKPKLASPFALSVITLLVALLGTLAGALLVISPLELRETDAFAMGQFNLIVGAALIGAVAGVMYWAPKITGRKAVDAIGGLNVLVLLGGAVLAGLPMCIIGFSTRFTGLEGATDALTWVSAIGCALLAAGALLGLLGLLSAARRGAEDAGQNPWESGQTLEWACDSPPPTGNFGVLAVVRSAEPLLDEEA